jgi:hypothetical protein
MRMREPCHLRSAAKKGGGVRSEPAMVLRYGCAQPCGFVQTIPKLPRLPERAHPAASGAVEFRCASGWKEKSTPLLAYWPASESLRLRLSIVPVRLLRNYREFITVY